MLSNKIKYEDNNAYISSLDISSILLQRHTLIVCLIAEIINEHLLYGELFKREFYKVNDNSFIKYNVTLEGFMLLVMKMSDSVDKKLCYKLYTEFLIARQCHAFTEYLPTILRQVADKLQSTQEKQAELLKFANALTQTSTSITVGDFAKVLQQNGVTVGRNRLYQYLKDKGYVLKNNQPSQRMVERGYLELKETVIETGDYKSILCSTLITPKGQQKLFKEMI